MTNNANAHRQHRNQRLRDEVKEIISSAKNGDVIKTSDIAGQLHWGHSEVSNRSAGRFIAELCPEMVVPAGTGHWVRQNTSEATDR